MPSAAGAPLFKKVLDGVRGDVRNAKIADAVGEHIHPQPQIGFSALPQRWRSVQPLLERFNRFVQPGGLGNALFAPMLKPVIECP